MTEVGGEVWERSPSEAWVRAVALVLAVVVVVAGVMLAVDHVQRGPADRPPLDCSGPTAEQPIGCYR